jgi:hypothetical protein
MSNIGINCPCPTEKLNIQGAKKMEQIQTQTQQPQTVDINVIINQALSIQADAMTQMRQLTGIMSQMAQEIQRLAKDNNDLKQPKA